MIGELPRGLKNNIYDHLLVFIIFLSVIPLFFTRLIPIIGSYGLWYAVFIFVWFFVTFLIRPVYYLKPSLYRLSAFLLVIFTILALLLTSNYSLAGRFLSYSSLFVFYFFYEFNRMEGKNFLSYRVLLLLLPFFLYTCINTIVGLEGSPYLSRYIKSSGEQTMEIYSQGVGGYSFIYASLMLIPLFLQVSLSRNKRIKMIVRIVFFVSSAFLFVMLIKSNYFTALVLASFSMLLVFLIASFRSSYRVFFYFLYLLFFVGFIILFMTFDLWIDALFSYVDFLFGTAKTAERINALLSYLAYDYSNLETLESRKGVTTAGVMLTLQNLPFGLVFTFKYDQILSIITNHSFLLDMGSIFGFFGVIYMFFVFYPFVKRLTRMQGITLLPVFLVFLGLSFSNNLTPSIAFCVFFVALLFWDEGWLD